MRPIALNSVFSNDKFYQIKEYVQTLRKNQQGTRHKRFVRYAIFDDPFLRRFYGEIQEIMEQNLGFSIEATYCYLSMYDLGLGVCPPHVDNKYCRFNFDLIVEQNQSWPLCVNSKCYDLKENQALIFCGLDKHYRPKMDSGTLASSLIYHFMLPKEHKLEKFWE